MKFAIAIPAAFWVAATAFNAQASLLSIFREKERMFFEKPRQRTMLRTKHDICSHAN